ncbi:hypothetical protein WKK05_37095 (plasmid) [Nostoc sp. UHCC 0302]|uniref:hypothetical protein n=1 Tax=Nostoc sp. UHCC 0302 TaxID=3134896 RepID=UPI00311CB188
MKLAHKLAVTTAGVLCFTTLNFKPEQARAVTISGDVLTANTIVNGFSLTDAAKAIAPFQDQLTIGPDSSLLPNTPFQLLTLAANTYNVTSNTYFYVPLSSVNNSPPILGTFPPDSSQNAFYWFDPTQLGGQDLSIIVDGRATAIGSDYLAGPVTRNLPFGGNSTIVLAAFLSPLSPGEHTVQIQGKYNGELVGGPCVPNVCVSFNVSYKVNSQPVPEPEISLAILAAGASAWFFKQHLKTSKLAKF